MTRTTKSTEIPRKLPEAVKESPHSSVEHLDPLQEQLKRQVGELLPPKSREEIIRRITTVFYSEQFSGPIAHPKHLVEYEEILPGAADRIVRMAENQQNHQISMEKFVAEKEYEDRRLGMIAGALVFSGLIGSAFFSAYLGNNIAAGLFLTTAAIGGVGLFVNGRKDT